MSFVLVEKQISSCLEGWSQSQSVTGFLFALRAIGAGEERTLAKVQLIHRCRCLDIFVHVTTDSVANLMAFQFVKVL